MGKNLISQLPNRITCVLEYSLAERNNSVNITREKKTKQHLPFIYGIVLYQCREDHTNTCLEIMLGLSSTSFGSVVSLHWQCGACESHVSASLCSLKGELKTDTVLWRLHHFTTSLQNDSRGWKYKEVKAVLHSSGKCFLYFTCCRESPKAFWVILQCHRAYSQTQFQYRSKFYSKISLWSGG